MSRPTATPQGNAIPAFLARSAGISRAAYQTYLPAVFIAGLPFLIAALAIGAAREPRKPMLAPAAA